ncbi:MAG: polysaccharide biosynthesis/export family protein [Hyphomicrobiales bacterium]|nr:polysaccharide biosynthesis/export family protein [Hyphomicrobiales bacterium]
MLTMMRIGRLWALWLAVLATSAVVPGWALAAGRVLTPQDSISIKVVNQPDMDTTTRVETDGTISFPYVGRIRAAGLSEDQLARTIERQLAARQIVTEPHVLVEISTFGTQASVQGQVGVPGVYTLDRPTNLTQLLSRAGGLRDAGLGGTVTVRRGGTVRKFESRDVQAGRGPGADFRIANNDEVFVDQAPFFYLYGYVNRAGEYPLLRPLTVQQAISIGGGLAILGSEWRIRVKRMSGNGQTYEVPASLDDQVEAGDTIIVSERIF